MLPGYSSFQINFIGPAATQRGTQKSNEIFFRTGVNFLTSNYPKISPIDKNIELKNKLAKMQKMTSMLTLHNDLNFYEIPKQKGALILDESIKKFLLTKPKNIDGSQQLHISLTNLAKTSDLPSDEYDNRRSTFIKRKGSIVELETQKLFAPCARKNYPLSPKPIFEGKIINNKGETETYQRLPHQPSRRFNLESRIIIKSKPNKLTLSPMRENIHEYGPYALKNKHIGSRSNSILLNLVQIQENNEFHVSGDASSLKLNMSQSIILPNGRKNGSLYFSGALESIQPSKNEMHQNKKKEVSSKEKPFFKELKSASTVNKQNIIKITPQFNVNNIIPRKKSGEGFNKEFSFKKKSIFKKLKLNYIEKACNDLSPSINDFTTLEIKPEIQKLESPRNPLYSPVTFDSRMRIDHKAINIKYGLSIPEKQSKWWKLRQKIIHCAQYFKLLKLTIQEVFITPKY